MLRCAANGVVEPIRSPKRRALYAGIHLETINKIIPSTFEVVNRPMQAFLWGKLVCVLYLRPLFDSVMLRFHALRENPAYAPL